MIRFLLCNVFVSGIIGILLIAKRIFKNNLSGRMQYNLWFLLLGLLAVPFIPLRPIGFSQIFSWFRSLICSPASDTEAAVKEAADAALTGNANWMNDFALSVNSKTPSVIGYILFGLWIAGIFAMTVLVIKSYLRLRTIEKSALPLQNPAVHRLYHHCIKEMEMEKDISVYSTAYLKSPIAVGLLKPRIYLPIHLISNYKESDLRYMLLHELQHCKHKDALASHLMNLAGVIYWFHPLVWFALREMRNDREIACDTSVLQMLDEDSYRDYGNTLINLAEKISLTPFPFAAGLGGNAKQMRKRIINIASYQKPTFGKSFKGMTAFMLTAVLLLCLSPMLSTYAAKTSHYQWNSSYGNISYGNISYGNISYADLSNYFGEYKGSFVLYDLERDAWIIHDLEHASLRVAPDSTYKIYDALFGLEEGVITPDDSLIAWNGQDYPFDAWNADQTLTSAMQSSVNWYFQTMDEQLGASCVYHYIQEIGYGNENMSGGLASYWMESSLEISPIEQVELLTELYRNDFGFAPENINAVKDAICLSSSDAGTLYGKTGTGRVDGQDVNGWFIGYIEVADNTYFFATNIQNDSDATGSMAAEITKSVLSDMNLLYLHTSLPTLPPSSGEYATFLHNYLQIE